MPTILSPAFVHAGRWNRVNHWVRSAHEERFRVVDCVRTALGEDQQTEICVGVSTGIAHSDSQGEHEVPLSSTRRGTTRRPSRTRKWKAFFVTDFRPKLRRECPKVGPERHHEEVTALTKWITKDAKTTPPCFVLQAHRRALGSSVSL